MPSSELTLRDEVDADVDAVQALVVAAFADEAEGVLVSALRGEPDTISLVAERDGVVGHILFSACEVEGTPAMALAPVAVLPNQQQLGIGKALCRAGIQACRARGHKLIIVLGHPDYYPKFGFIPAQPLGIMSPWTVGDAYCMVLELVPGALQGVSGTVSYHAAFTAP